MVVMRSAWRAERSNSADSANRDCFDLESGDLPAEILSCTLLVPHTSIHVLEQG